MTRILLWATAVLAVMAAGCGEPADDARAPEAATAAARAARARPFWEKYRAASHERSEGRLAAAVPLYVEALAARPDHEDSLYYLGNCYVELGQYGEAVESYRKLIAVNPSGSSRGYMQLGLIYASLDLEAPRDLARAEELFRQALGVDPDSGAPLGLAEVALLQGRPDAARALLEGVNRENTMSIAAPYLLGYLAAGDGQRADAWRWFQLAVSRGEVKKLPVAWTEEGDVKASPELRWRALARQSVFGEYWIALRAYLKKKPTPADMDREYAKLTSALATQRARG